MLEPRLLQYLSEKNEIRQSGFLIMMIVNEVKNLRCNMEKGKCLACRPYNWLPRRHPIAQITDCLWNERIDQFKLHNTTA